MVRKLRAWHKAVEEIRDVATMHTARFDGIGEEAQKVDSLIKRKTERWRETWLVYPLTILLQDLAAELERQRRKQQRRK